MGKKILLIIILLLIVSVWISIRTGTIHLVKDRLIDASLNILTRFGD